MPDIPDTSDTSEPRRPMPTPEGVKADLNTAADALASAGGDMVEAAGAQAAEIKDAAAAQLGEAAEMAKSFAGEHKNVAAEQIGGVSAALDKVADELAHDEHGAPAAGYARKLAAETRRFSDMLRESSIDDLMGMAQGFGRRQPMAFLGAAALAGFVAGRFAIASKDRRRNAPLPAPPMTTPTEYQG
jgi:hypothetical protein